MCVFFPSNDARLRAIFANLFAHAATPRHARHATHKLYLLSVWWRSRKTPAAEAAPPIFTFCVADTPSRSIN